MTPEECGLKQLPQCKLVPRSALLPNTSASFALECGMHNQAMAAHPHLKTQ